MERPSVVVEEAYREYVTEERRSRSGCCDGRMHRYFRDETLGASNRKRDLGIVSELRIPTAISAAVPFPS
jgi:hypothetical protein